MPRGRLFCDLPAHITKSLDSITSVATHPKGSVLFVEGQPTRGIFVISSGRIKLSSSTGGENLVIARVAEPGELIGLPGTISGRRCGATAEVIESAKVSFIGRDKFIQFLLLHSDAAVKVAQLLTEIYESAHQEVQSKGHYRTAPEKLARFVLDWSVHHAQNRDRLLLPLTQEEIAGMIGTSRETVTRVLTRFKKEEILTIKGAMVVILNRAALEHLAAI